MRPCELYVLDHFTDHSNRHHNDHHKHETNPPKTDSPDPDPLPRLLRCVAAPPLPDGACASTGDPQTIGGVANGDEDSLGRDVRE